MVACVDVPRIARTSVWILSSVLVLGPALASAEDEKAKVVQKGSKVGIEYTLKLEDGTLADASRGEPLVYEQGAGQVLPALETAVGGLEVGQEKQFTLPPEEGYGPVREELFRSVPVEQIPEGSRHVGATLVARNPSGGEYPATVREVREEEIVLDLNHPLAGKVLIFDVKVVSID